jgi:hypothetical protein
MWDRRIGLLFKIAIKCRAIEGDHDDLAAVAIVAPLVVFFDIVRSMG